MEPFFDLASLTKPLVTAPLVFRNLELGEDFRKALGLERWPTALTPEALLTHTAGLPPWLPFTGEPLAVQLGRDLPQGVHPLIRRGVPGISVYSDVGFRLLGERVQEMVGRPWQVLGAEATGLSPAPFPGAPTPLPEAQDGDAWRLLAPETPVPAAAPHLPHDLNARAGMVGHAGFGGTPCQVKRALNTWLELGMPQRMAIRRVRAEDGLPWGLGLHQIPRGAGRFGELLDQLPTDLGGVHVRWDSGHELSDHAPGLGEPDFESPWWGHFGYTGGALFVRPDTGLVVCLLVHRRGPSGELLGLEALRSRRWRLLSRFLQEVVC